MGQKAEGQKNRSKKKSPETTAVAKPLSEGEVQIIEAVLARKKRASEVPLFQDRKPMMKGKSGQVGYAIAVEKMEELLKTDHGELAGTVISSAGKVTAFKQTPDEALNLAIQQFAALQPQNYPETMLMNQMIQVNAAASKCMSLAFSENQTAYVKEMNVKLATKLHRTFVAQIEALQKLRGKGGQKVTVEHVHVHQGGQAIVGNVEKGGG